MKKIWCLTAGSHRVVKEAGKQAERVINSETQLDIYLVLYILGYSVTRKRVNNLKNDLLPRPGAWLTKTALEERFLGNTGSANF